MGKIIVCVCVASNARTLKSCLSIELHREKMFSQSQELASLQIPLCYVNHCSQVGLLRFMDHRK